MNTSKLPRRLAMIGVALAFGLLVMWWYINQYNPFHLPPAGAPVSYSEPKLMSFLEYMTFVLCPGELLGVAASDATGYAVPVLIWIVAAFLNGLLYYCVGLVIAGLVKRLRRAPATQGMGGRGALPQ